MSKTNEPINAGVKQRHSINEPVAARPRMLVLRGHRISWVGIESNEALQRGCDQSAWLERLAQEGIRHVLVPLNGASEDACMFARKHVIQAGHESPLYDLEHRDEGFFTRLKFLMEAAAETGVLLGLSLFDAQAGAGHGPMRGDANVQGLSLEEEKTSAEDARRAAILSHAAEWVCSAVRASRGVYVQVLRNTCGEPGPLERALSGRIARIFSQQGEDLSPERLGPWVVERNAVVSAASRFSAPLELSRTVRCPKRKTRQAAALNFYGALERAGVESGMSSADALFGLESPGQTALLRFEAGALEGERMDWLWQAFFRGWWPVVALRVAEKDSARALENTAALARFSSAWSRRSALRACAGIVQQAAGEKCPASFAAEDDGGRFFIYFKQPALEGLRLRLPAGLQRYSWIDPLSGKCLDRGDGVNGGARADITGLNDARARLLIVEPSEAADAQSSL